MSMPSSNPSQDNSQNNSESNSQSNLQGSTPIRRVVDDLEIETVKSAHYYRWRSVDIAVTAVLGVATGVITWGFNFVYIWFSPFLRSVLPGLTSLIHGVWYFAAVLAVLIVRKPGAGIMVNVVGVLMQTLMGSKYAFAWVIISAIMQGVASEIPFALTKYRKFSLLMSVLSGGLTGIEYGVYLILFRFQGVAFISPRGITHLISEFISGLVIAGLMSWILYRAIALTGVISSFASGRVQIEKKKEE